MSLFFASLLSTASGGSLLFLSLLCTTFVSGVCFVFATAAATAATCATASASSTFFLLTERTLKRITIQLEGK